jgi:hypothetical protein
MYVYHKKKKNKHADMYVCVPPRKTKNTWCCSWATGKGRTADMYVCAPQKKNKHADIYVCVPQNKKEQYMVLLVGDREGTDRGIEVKAISGVSESDLPALYTG